MPVLANNLSALLRPGPNYLRQVFSTAGAKPAVLLWWRTGVDDAQEFDPALRLEGPGSPPDLKISWLHAGRAATG